MAKRSKIESRKQRSLDKEKQAQEDSEMLAEIKDSTFETSEILNKFSGVFDSIHKAISNQTVVMKELLRVNVDQVEIAKRREELESVSSAPEQKPQVQPQTKPDEGRNVVEQQRNGEGLLNNFLGSLFGNMFGNGRAVGMAIGGIGGLLKTAGVATIIAPWLSNFLSETIRLSLADTDWTAESKDIAAQFAGSVAMRGAIGAAIGGWRGALIGAVSSVIDTGINQMAELIGKDAADLESNAATIFGFKISWSDVMSAMSVGLAGLAVTVGPKLMSWVIKGLVGAVASAIGAPAFLVGLGAVAVGILGKLGYDYIQSRREKMLDEVKKNLEDTTGSLGEGNEVGIWDRTKNRFGFGNDESTAGQQLSKIYHGTMGKVNSGDDLEDADKDSIKTDLKTVLSKAEVPIDLEDPKELNPNSMNSQAAGYVIDTLKAIGDFDLAKKWEEAVTAMKKSQEDPRDRAQKLVSEREDLERELLQTQTLGDDFPNKQKLLDNIKSRIRDVEEEMRKVGATVAPSGYVGPGRGADITPAPASAQRARTVMSAGPQTQPVSVNVVANSGNKTFVKGGDSTVNASVRQSTSNYRMPLFDSMSGMPGGVSG